MLLCSFLNYVRLDGLHEYEVVDLFAGKARISTLASMMGYRAAAYDIDHAKAKTKRKSIWRASRSVMDINSDAGFVCLDLNTSSLSPATNPNQPCRHINAVLYRQGSQSSSLSRASSRSSWLAWGPYARHGFQCQRAQPSVML